MPVTQKSFVFQISFVYFILSKNNCTTFNQKYFKTKMSEKEGKMFNVQTNIAKHVYWQKIVQCCIFRTVNEFWKTFKNHEHFSSWALHEPLVCMVKKGTFFMIFECLLLFSTMQTLAEACICWSKYTTIQWFLVLVKSHK